MKIRAKDSLPRAEVFAPSDAQESMLMYGISGLEFEPTDHMPGSVEKIAVLARRVELGLPLFHKEDRVTCDGMGGFVPKADPWAIPGFEFDDSEYDDSDYEIEKNLPQEFR